MQIVAAAVKSYLQQIAHEVPHASGDANGFYVHGIDFFAANVNTLPALLRRLQPLCSQAPVVEYYVEQVAELGYLCLVNDKLEDFDTLSEAIQSAEPATHWQPPAPYESGQLSLFVLKVRKAQVMAINELLLSLVYGPELSAEAIYEKRRPLLKKRYRRPKPSAAWGGQFEAIVPNFAGVFTRVVASR